jgi:hypothetical protein
MRLIFLFLYVVGVSASLSEIERRAWNAYASLLRTTNDARADALAESIERDDWVGF